MAPKPAQARRATHREREILEALRMNGGSSRIQPLAIQLGVSEETIRRNVKKLADEELVQKVHGGVHLPDADIEPSFQQRMDQNPEAKRRIAARVAAIFKNGAGTEIGSANIGPVTASDRGNNTGLLFRTTSGNVPKFTRTIDVVLETDRATAPDSDGYADNLSLILFAPSGATALDDGRGDIHTAVIDWDDGTIVAAIEPGEVLQERGSATFLKEHIYDNAGVFQIGQGRLRAPPQDPAHRARIRHR